MKLFKANFYPLLALAIPLALTGSLESGVFFFETLFLAHLSPDALAAGGLVTWLFGTFAVIQFGVLGAINILVAQKHGAQDEHGISLVVRDGIWLALLFFIPAFILFWYMPSFFLLFGQSPAVVTLAQSFLHSLVWGLLPDLVMIALLEVIIGLGHTRIVLIFSMICVSLNIFFSYVLIFGKFGFPALGVAGAGWGTSISYWISGLLLTFYFFTNEKYKSYTKLLFVSHKPSYLTELLQIGIPMGMMYCIEVGFFFVLSLLMGTFGSNLLAANQIALQYMGTLMSIVFSMAQAITVRTGYLLGSGDNDSAERATYAGIIIIIIAMLIVAACYWVFPTALISLDLNTHAVSNREIIKYATQFLAICALFQILESIRIALFGALRGMKDTHFTLLISIVSFWGINLPAGYFFATRLGLGGNGLWWGMVLGAALSIPLLFWRFKLKVKDYEMT